MSAHVDPSIYVSAIAAIGSIFTARVASKSSSKISETHKQVTVNHHSSDFPTVLDRIDDVRVAVLNLREDFLTHVAHSGEMDLLLMELKREVRDHDE